MPTATPPPPLVHALEQASVLHSSVRTVGDAARETDGHVEWRRTPGLSARRSDTASRLPVIGGRRVGVEEEVLLVDPGSGMPSPVSSAARAAAAGATSEVLDAELQRQQLEIRTEPCRSLSELDAELRCSRRTAADAAQAVGAAVAALATSPLPIRPSPTPSERYERMAERFAVLPDELLTCGCHIHVELDSGEQGVAVLDRIRVWLPVLLALS